MRLVKTLIIARLVTLQNLELKKVEIYVDAWQAIQMMEAMNYAFLQELAIIVGKIYYIYNYWIFLFISAS